MEITFSNPSILIQGLLAGIVFGFLLRKAHVCRFDVIVGQFLFRDFTVVKVMFTAIIVGSIGIWTMLGTGFLESITVKPFNLFGNAVGGAIFGVGMALLGLCPGTCVVAMGEGTRHSYWGFLGMLIGAFLYSEFYAIINESFLSHFSSERITLGQEFGISPWWFVAGVTLVGLLLFAAIEKYEKSTR